jgi:peptidoglycan/LPS O-acetylase OafA/YrhL
LNDVGNPELGTERIQYLDGWRGLAIGAVMVAHFVSAAHLNLGRLGVELFFVLSGRLMAEILFVRTVPLASFFPRRISRVYPALFAYLVIMLFVSYWYGVGGIRIEQYVASVLFVFNYSQLWMGRSDAIDHVWSLCIEEHIYIVLGLLAYIHRLRPLPLVRILVALITVSVTIGTVQTVMGLDYYQVYWRTDVRGASILIGVVAYLTLKDIALTSVPRWLPLALAGGALVLALNRMPDPLKYSVGTALLASSLVLMRAAPARALNLIEHPVVLRIGLWSYSMYLWQQPFSKFASSAAGRVIALPLALITAVLSYYLIERPARRIINSFVDRRRAQRAITVPAQA